LAFVELTIRNFQIVTNPGKNTKVKGTSERGEKKVKKLNIFLPAPVHDVTASITL